MKKVQDKEFGERMVHMAIEDIFFLKHPIKGWEHLGIAIERGTGDEFDSGVTGDPCIVWDEDQKCYHMFYFAQKHTARGEENCNAHATSTSVDESGVKGWKKLGPIKYANPDALYGDTHKPWILMDPYRPNIPVKINGEYWLFTVSRRGRNKIVQLAKAESLDGPWKLCRNPVVDIGSKYSFDGYHADTVTAYWFEKRGEILIFYKGYPLKPQEDQPHSPYGSSSAVAVMRPSDESAVKLGKVISPSLEKGHWTAGWIGGLQIFPAAHGGWYGLLTASSSPPLPVESEPMMREPAPSLGGWAYTPEDWPVKGWIVEDEPIVRLEDIPEKARKWGENTNLWRHHMLVHSPQHKYLYYNAGSYGQERMFVRRAVH